MCAVGFPLKAGLGRSALFSTCGGDAAFAQAAHHVSRRRGL